MLAALTIGSGFADEAAKYQTMVIDDTHSAIKHSDGSEGVNYEAKPAPGIVVDVRGYQFKIPPKLNVDAPNSIQVLIGAERKYSAEWKPVNGKQSLDATTLKPLQTSPPFTGFHAGDSVVLGIGHSVTEDHTLKFGVIWFGMVKIK